MDYVISAKIIFRQYIMPRKYAGPLMPGTRSAKVPRALVKSVPRKYKPKYKLSAPVRDQVKKIVKSDKEQSVQHNVAFGDQGTGYVNNQFPGVPNTSNAHIMKIILGTVDNVRKEIKTGLKDEKTNFHLRHQNVPIRPPLGMLAGIEDEALTDLLTSWYYSGYYTGRYQAIQELKREGKI